MAKEFLYQIEVKLPQQLAEMLISMPKRSKAARKAVDMLLTEPIDSNAVECRAKKADAQLMVPVSIYLYISQVKALDETARKHGASRSSLIRLAMSRYLGREW